MCVCVVSPDDMHLYVLRVDVIGPKAMTTWVLSSSMMMRSQGHHSLRYVCVYHTTHSQCTHTTCSLIHCTFSTLMCVYMSVRTYLYSHSTVRHMYSTGTVMTTNV